MHASIPGADDPDLQMWVAATLYATGIFMYEEVFGALGEIEADDVYREWSIMAESLRVPPGVWPQNRRAFWKYWDVRIAELDITPQAKRVANDLFYNKPLPFGIQIFLPMVKLMTTYMLPDRVRDGYGLGTSSRGLRFYNTTVSIIRVAYPALPECIRLFPMRHYLARMRTVRAVSRI